MSAFAKWLEANRALRVVLVAITFPLPLANVLSGAVMVLLARTAGLRTAALDAAAAGLLLAAMLALTGGPWQSGLGGAVALWGGAVLGGHLLGRFGSVDLAVQALIGATMACVLLAAALVGDPRSYWQPILEKLFATAGVPKVEELPADWLGTVAALMHGIIGASVLSSCLLGLVVGTWLGGGPEIGAWRQRFLELRLGRVLSAVAAAALLGLVAGFANPAGGIALVLGTGFVAQGLAIVHWTADRRAWPRIWPLALYGPLLLSAPVAGLLLLGLALVGFVDNFLDLRRARSNVV